MLKQFIRAKIKRKIKDAMTFSYPKVKVKIDQGIVKGCREKLPNGQSYLRFSGIPYAKKPINELRFKSPEKLLKFETAEIDCTREGDSCFHKSTYTKKLVGSENCLHLNVYVPDHHSSRKALAVMVYIHGGGFHFDSNSVDLYSPEHLLMEDVIVVTVNYRLHALGFLSLPSMGISGNAGLKDQQMALQWVYENISSFNGNPDNICLFGESAGASSVYLHVLSSKSRKFINNAICQSGSALDSWLFQKDGIDKTKKLAKRLGTRSDNDKDIYETLMTAPPDLIFKNLLKDQLPDEMRRTLPFVFKPIVEVESDDAFITKPPLDTLKSQAGEIDMPIMLGSTSGDGMTMTSYYRKNIDSFKKDKVKLIPNTVNIDPFSHEAELLGEEISQFYLGERGACEETLDGFIDLMSDFYFNVPQAMTVMLNKQYHPKIQNYMFEFDFDGDLNFLKKALNMTAFSKACHMDDISYIFRHQIIDIVVSENSREWKMRERMCKLWTNFAKYNNPTPNGNDSPLALDWNPVKSDDTDFKYMVLGENSRMVSNNHSARIDFWRKIYEKYNGSFLNPTFNMY